MGILETLYRDNPIDNPRYMIMYSYPKVGKTSNLLLLREIGTMALIDFEGGSDFYEGFSVNVNDIYKLNDLKIEFEQEKILFDFIVLDTITSLYSKIINVLAVKDYNRDKKDKKPDDFDLSLLDYGKGHFYKRAALQKVINFFKGYCKCLIVTAHVADKNLGDDDKKLMVKDIDIEGKNKDILAYQTDATGYLFRRISPVNKNISQNVLSFNNGINLVSGTRIQRLEGEEVVISEKDEKGNLTCYWDRIFKNWK